MTADHNNACFLYSLNYFRLLLRMGLITEEEASSMIRLSGEYYSVKIYV